MQHSAFNMARSASQELKSMGQKVGSDRRARPLVASGAGREGTAEVNEEDFSTANGCKWTRKKRRRKILGDRELEKGSALSMRGQRKR
jgi:hypothetical protein